MMNNFFQNEDVLLPLFLNAMNVQHDRDAVILTNLLLNDVLYYLNEVNSNMYVYHKHTS